MIRMGRLARPPVGWWGPSAKSSETDDFRIRRSDDWTNAMHRYRSHTCGELRATDVGTDVRLSGWLHNRRDLGGILFIDLRDHYGITQLVVRPGTPAYEAARQLGQGVRGPRRRPGRGPRGAENVNPELPTGEVEVEVARGRGARRRRPAALHGLPRGRRQRGDGGWSTASSTCAASACTATSCCAPPSSPSSAAKMTALGFNELATPILSATSPEGARDFLVPSRAARRASSTRCRRPRSSSSSC